MDILEEIISGGGDIQFKPIQGTAHQIKRANQFVFLLRKRIIGQFDHINLKSILGNLLHDFAVFVHENAHIQTRVGQTGFFDGVFQPFNADIGSKDS